MELSRTPRWDYVLPAAALLVSVLLVALASLVGYAFAERETLALDGRILGIAHDVEWEVRQQGEGKALAILDELWRATRPEVRGIVLEDAMGTRVAHVGGDDKTFPAREVVIFVGPQGWAAASRGAKRRGWRRLHVFLDPRAGEPPASIRYLPLAAVLVGLGLIALALLGGRLLVKERRRAAAAARSHRLEALGRAGAGLAHQLRNPLATIKGSCQLLVERLEDPALRERAGEAVAQANRMDNLLATLLDFARPPRPQPRVIELADTLEELLRQHANVEVQGAVDFTLRADPEHLLQILENLVVNATAHAPEGSPVEISAIVSGETLQLTVADRGPGPGPEPEQLFQPYVSRRADGTGLGLPIARALAEIGDGQLVLQDRPGGGCLALLTLPATGREA